MDKNTLYYFFSSSAQAVSAIVGLSGAVAVFKYGILMEKLRFEATNVKEWWHDRMGELISKNERNHIKTLSRDNLSLACYAVEFFLPSEMHRQRLKTELEI